MALFNEKNLSSDGCDPNFVYEYKVGHGPNAVKICHSARLKFGRRALIEYDDKEGAIFIRSCSMNIIKEIVALLYQQYLRESNGPTITIQVCNHNYLLADALHRQNGWKPLLRDYQALVVDEAHRLPEAAQQMATCRLSTQGLAQLAQQLGGLHLTRAAQQVTACARALAGVYAPQQNEANAEHGGLPPVQVPFTVTTDGTLALAALQKTLSEIQDTYRARLTLPLLHQLQEMRTRAAAFAQPDDTTVCYVEYSGIKSGPGLSHLSLCAVPRDLPRQL